MKKISRTFCQDANEMQHIIFYNKAFVKFGLAISPDKSKTIVSVPEDTKKKGALISSNAEPIENVRQCKYPGHVLSNEIPDSSAAITYQVESSQRRINA